MNRIGDASIRAAVDDSLPIEFTYQDEDGDPFDVTGYSARSSLLVYDGSVYGRELYTPTVTVGTTDGLFSLTVTTVQLAALLAACPGGEPARFRLWATGPAGTPSEIEIAHGSILILPPGAAVSGNDVTLVEQNYSVTVHTVGARGDTGPAGPAGPSGGFEVQEGQITTSSTTPTVIGELDLSDYRGKSVTATLTFNISRSGVPPRTTQDVVAASVNGSGVVTVDAVQEISGDTPSFGSIDYQVGTDLLRPTAYPADATSTVWAMADYVVQERP